MLLHGVIHAYLCAVTSADLAEGKKRLKFCDPDDELLYNFYFLYDFFKNVTFRWLLPRALYLTYGCTLLPVKYLNLWIDEWGD